MSNRRKRRARRQSMTPEQRWAAERYKAVHQYDPAELRRVLIEDGVARRIPPLGWFVAAVHYLADRYRMTDEAVFQQIDGEVVALCGQHLPTRGVAW